MLKVGLTGGIGTGKSTVSRMFADLGCYIIDSDAITRSLFAPGQIVNRAVAAAFGPAVVAPDGSINRAVLAELVFHDSALRQKLNSLVHPAILQRQAAFIKGFAAEDPDGIVIVEAALMVEVGTYQNYDKLIVVTCSPEVQRHRIKERSGLTDEQIESRIASQMPLEEKVKYADFVIDNSADRESTRRKVEKVYDQLRDPVDPDMA
jgi:dephospho-CoA kinase